MKSITFSDYRKMIHAKGAENLGQFLPLTVIVNGEPAFIVDKVNECIPMSDFHPRMKNIMRAMENKARMGMPKVEKIKAEEFVEA